MSIDNKENLVKEKIADIIFSYAGICHIDNINEDIEKAYDNDITNPNQKELDHKIENLIRDYRRKQIFKGFLMSVKKVSKVAAIVLVTVVILFTISISSVDALRVMFFNVFVDMKGDYSKIIIDKDSNSNNGSVDTLKNDMTLKNCYIPEYIPKEFNLENIISQNEKIIMIFKDTNSNSFIFEQSSDLNREYMVDTENAVTETLSIQGREAIMITKDKIITILWDNNERMFNIYGQIPKEQILKFCEHIYLKK